MKKILFLSSALIMTVCGAFAEDAATSDKKITGGAGTCTVDVLGVSADGATANTIATWSLNDYECGAGQYLDEDTLTCTTCPAGSYCPGGTFTIENAASGTFDCPAGYTDSAAGAGTNNECYTACTLETANIAHATAVSGNDYYGTTDADTCTPTNCELGYQVDGGEMTLVEKTPVIPVDYETAGNGNYAFINPDGSTRNNGIELSELSGSGTYAVDYDYGRVYGHASCQSTTDPASVYFFSNFEAVAGGTMSMEEFRTGALAVTSEAKANVIVDYAKAVLMMLTGQGDMTEAEAEEALTKYFVTFSESPAKNYATDSTGQYCYCQMDGFSPMTDGVLGEKTSVTSAPWVFDYDLGSAGICASGCADYCAATLWTDGVINRALRAAVYGALDAVEAGGMCKITETDCPAGQYLAIVGDAMMCVPCKSGSYCPGGVYTIESENKGTNVCPTTHPNSDAGAGADTQCYTACTLDTANIAHATAVSGNDYYGTGTDTCSATECDTGYHVNNDIELVEQTPLIPVDYTVAGTGSASIGQDGSSYGSNADGALTANGTWATKFDYGIVYGKASCQPQIKDAGMAYIISNQSALMSGGITVEEFRTAMLPLAGQAKTDFVVKVLQDVQSGKMSMEDMYKAIDVVFGSDYDAEYKTTDSGQYCYCQMDGFAPATDGVIGEKSTVTSAPWVFYIGYRSADNCASHCAPHCADGLWGDAVDDRAIRAAVFGALGYTEAGTCAANTINIDWNPDNGGAHTQNMCYYDGEITLPDEPVKVGYTFSGWKLVEPNSTPVQ